MKYHLTIIAIMAALPLVSCGDEPSWRVNIPAKLVSEWQSTSFPSYHKSTDTYKAEYDRLNRPVKITRLYDDGVTYFTQIDYSQGTIKSWYPGKEYEEILKFELDRDGRIRKVTDITSGESNPKSTTEYIYNTDGYISSLLRYKNIDGHFTGYIKTTYEYNGNTVTSLTEIDGRFDQKNIFTFTDKNDRSGTATPTSIFSYTPFNYETTLFMYWSGMLGRRIAKLCATDESTILYFENGVFYTDTFTYTPLHQLEFDNDGYVTSLLMYGDLFKFKYIYAK